MTTRVQLFGSTARVVSPQETLERITPVAKMAGVTRLSNITGLDCVGLPVWMATRPLARSLSVSQGKGLYTDNAKASALMEAIEVYHAEHFIERGVEVTLGEAHQDERFVSIDALPIRPSTEVGSDTKLRWIKAMNYQDGSQIWYPREIADLNICNRFPNQAVIASSSNGLASGNTVEEALLHAICEIIERDSVMHWLVGGTLSKSRSKRKLDLSTIDDELCQRVLEQIKRAGLGVSVWSPQSVIGIPCFHCAVFDQDRVTPNPTKATGDGCHPLKSIALMRALTEALQSRLTFIAGARDDMYWSRYNEDIPMHRLSNKIWMEDNAAQTPNVSYAEIEDFSSSGDLADFLDQISARLRANGFHQLAVTNLTRAPFEVPVVHVFIPGMEFYLPEGDYTPGKRMREFVEELAS